MKINFITRISKYLTVLVFFIEIVNFSSAQTYSVSNCTYSPIAGIGTSLPQCDDCTSGLIPIGFTFPFYGSNYTQLNVSSNGFLSFESAIGSGCCSGQALPAVFTQTIIAWAWDDMYTFGSTFDYFTTGAAPNRIFVLNFNSVGFCCTSSNQSSVQIQLFETSGEIRMLSANNNHTGRIATMGIQHNLVGSTIVPGRNATSWVSPANECLSFSSAPLPCTAASISIPDGSGGPSIIDQQQILSNTCMANFAQTDLAQSFIPSQNMMNGASIELTDNVSGSGDITISLYSTLGGTVLATGTATGVLSGSWASVTWPPVALIPGNTYYIVVTGTNSSHCWAGNTSNPYPSGQTFANAGFNSFPSFDYSFTTTHSNIAGDVCGTTIPLNNDPSNCSANLVLNSPVYSGTCSPTNLIWSMTGATVDSSPVSGINNLLSYDYNVGTTNITYSLIDEGGNTSTCSFNVVVTDTELPIAICQPITVQLDASGNISVTPNDINNGSYDNCSIASMTVTPFDFTCAEIGTNNVTLTVTDVNGNISTCVAVVTVEDNIPPIITCPGDITVSNDPGGCSAVVNYVVSVTDNCSGGLPNILFVSDIAFATEIPAALTAAGYSVTTVLNDYSAGNNATLQGSLAAYDLIYWHAVGTGFGDIHNASTFVNLNSFVNAGGSVFVTGYDIIASPLDIDLITFMGGTSSVDVPPGGGLGTVQGPANSLNTGAFNIIGLVLNNPGDHDALTGLQPGTIMVTPNGSGAEWSLKSLGSGEIAWVSSSQNSAAFPMWTTVGSGYHEALLNFASNSSGVISVSQTSGLPTGSVFPIGTTTNTFITVDASGNTATCSFDIIVTDTELPNAICQPITVQLDASGNVSVSANDINNGSFDNCGIASIQINGGTNQVYTCANVGVNSATLLVTDIHGNTSTCLANVTVEDNINPIAIGQDITVQLDATGTAIITANDINNGSSDICGIASLTIDISSFNCSNLGSNAVILTVTDNNGNISTQTQNVAVIDALAPVPDIVSLADLTVECSVLALTSPTATDNCAGLITGMHNASLPINTQGTTLVTWTYDDGNGNISTQIQNIVINDITAPVPGLVSLPDVMEECAVISLAAPSATDNCAGMLVGTHNAVLPITAQGTTIVTWTFDDGNGNVSTQNQNVIVDDVSAPVADVILLADVTAECEVTALVAPTATDNCVGSLNGAHNATLPITTQGLTILTWTYNDGNGNISTQTQNIIINDVTAPVPDVASLSDVIEECSVFALTAPTATDNCTGLITGTHNTTLPITNQGTIVVTWTYDDGNGNISTQDQNVIVNDITPPNAPVLAAFNGNCENSLPVPSTTDNCSGIIIGSTNDPLVYTVPGTYTVNWLFDDGNGNTETVAQTVNVTSSTTYSTLNINSCGTYTSPSGMSFGSNGIYTDVIPNATGCDSILTINLTINQSYIKNMTAQYCKEYTVPSGNMTYYSSGIYYDTLMAVGGCDSVLVIDVTILQVDNSVTQNDITLTSNASGAVYSWFNCSTGVDVWGATEQSFTPVYNGTYALVVFQNGCYDTSICYTINSAFLLNEEFDLIKVYPNPSNGIFYLENFSTDENDIYIYDMNGRIILEDRIIDQKHVIDLSDRERGIYILRFKNQIIRLVLN